MTLKDFYDLFSLTSLINNPTSYRNPKNPSCTDLMITNGPKFFQKSNVYETGLSEIHKTAVAVVKTRYRKLQPKIINHIKYKDFFNNRFRKVPINELSKITINNNDERFQTIMK